MDTADFLRHIQSLLWYQEQIVHVEQVPSREARTRDLDPPLDARLVQRLEDMGVSGLYTHQAEAVEKLRDGKNVIVATPAASGKSMCYNLPVLESLLEDRTSRALYLYPTKALSQDQEKKLAELMPASDGPRGIRHAIFDGDTPRPDRATIRRSSNIVITNPDMLHLGILPNHRAWYRTLRGLKYVVLDEAHVYRGVFGTHVANVMRRLRRLCRLVGSSPQFILCSATIANPGEHAERLVGEPFDVVEDDGSPYGGKDFVLWNPPMIDLGGRLAPLDQFGGYTGVRRTAEASYAHDDLRPQQKTGRADTRLRTRPAQADASNRGQAHISLPCQLPARGQAAHRKGSVRGQAARTLHDQCDGARR